MRKVKFMFLWVPEASSPKRVYTLKIIFMTMLGVILYFVDVSSMVSEEHWMGLLVWCPYIRTLLETHHCVFCCHAHSGEKKPISQF